VEDEVAERDDAARLRAALAALPEAQREVIALAYFGELSMTEIADRLSLPVGTVKGRMRLGLEKLRHDTET
jgi:RNA polymerase sigma-70 factor (ECF subfamily)